MRGTLRRWLQRFCRNQRGALLMETVLALGVFGIVGTAVLGAVQTSYISKTQFELQSKAETIIRNQVESAFEQAYKPPTDPNPTYLLITPPAGFSVTAESLTYDVTSPDISTVRVTVYHNGQPLKVFETVRANR